MNNSGFTFRGVREEMIETLLDMGINDFRVLDAMSQVPRHIFVDNALHSRAYENRSLTIGYKQTISQPYIVAKMTEHLISHTKSRGKIFDKVLELGSGCGYQSAVVTKFRENLSQLKIKNVLFKYGDGYTDWDKKLKYDGVLCAAAPRQYPQDLVDCLNMNSKIVIPVGNSKSQQLHVITKLEGDEIQEDVFEEVAFVPMLSGTSVDGNDS